MTSRSLVIGATGYVGRHVLQELRAEGQAVGSSRVPCRDCLQIRELADLDRILAIEEFQQIVLTAQLDREGVDSLLTRIDGPRWLVFSSTQLGASTPPPTAALAREREEVALGLGATVVRPTMVYGRGGDQNISRLIRWFHRLHLAFQVGAGDALVQPIHVADVASFVTAHRERPTPGCFELAGDEAIPSSELVEILRELLGVRMVRVSQPGRLIDVAAKVLRLRPDQIARLREDKTGDNRRSTATFGWSPSVLAHRLEQAVGEALP